MHDHKQKTHKTLQAYCTLRLYKITQIGLLHNPHQNHL